MTHPFPPPPPPPEESHPWGEAPRKPVDLSKPPLDASIPPPPEDPGAFPPPPPPPPQDAVFEGYRAPGYQSEFSNPLHGSGYQHGSRDPFEPPLEDPNYGKGVVDGVKDTALALLHRSWDFFYGMKTDRSPAPAIIFAFLLSVAIEVVNQLLALVIGTQSEEFSKLLSELGAALPFSTKAFGLFTIVVIPFRVAFTILIGSLILFGSAKLWGVFDKDYSFFIRIYCWTTCATLPLLLPLNAIPFVGGLFYVLLALVCYTAQLFLLYRGLRPHSDKPAGKLIGAILTPTLICCFCFVVAVAVVSLGAISAFGN